MKDFKTGSTPLSIICSLLSVICYLFFVICFLLSVVSEAAAQSFDLSITPPLLEVMIKPGKTVTQVYKLSNQGAAGQISFRLAAFEPADEKGSINLKLNPGSQPPPAWLNWFSLQNADLQLPGRFPLASGQTQELVLKIKVPKEVEEKDYYASLVFQVKPDEELIGASASRASGIIAANILLTVSRSGKPPKSGKILQFAVKKKSFLPYPLFDSFEAVPLVLRVANTGRYLFKPAGGIKIIGPGGRQTAFLPILPQNILAYSQRRLFLKEPPPALIKEIVWQSHGLKIGLFKAQAELALAPAGRRLMAEARFFLFPWKAVLAIIVLWLILAVVKKRLKKEK